MPGLLGAFGEQKTRPILHENGCTDAGESPQVLRGTCGHNATREEEERLEAMVSHVDMDDQCTSAILKHPVPYEETKEAVHLAVEEVGAQKQQEHREKTTHDSPSAPTRKEVQNTVMHREKGGASSLVNGEGRLGVLRLLRAFVLPHHLWNHTFMFFVAGHSRYAAVMPCFSWHKNIMVM